MNLAASLAKPMRLWPGRPYPLGATWDGAGVNFALFSENATRAELCLFDSPDAVKETVRIPLTEKTDRVWHAYLPDAMPGQIYGYRLDGPYDPSNGHRFNFHKVVLDPYAKLVIRDTKWDDSLFSYQIGEDDLSFDDRDSAPFAPLAAVVDTSFTWGDDRPLRTPWHKTLIYEAHVKGLTARHPDVPEHLRGTYTGIAHEAVIQHLKDLNVTAIELLPVHHFTNDRHLLEKGLRNYWGYNTLGYFAPYTGYASPSSRLDAVQQFKVMVRTLHAAGIEVILDVVYNHTSEGNQMGPTLSWKGIDNAAYYRLSPENKRYYMDFTGCGNTLDMQHPKALQLVMDSLRYWASEMHVDGFRFDLASTLARELYEVDKLGSFFDIIHQDPLLSQVKLIAEPWDIGPGGYMVGNFPPGWTEWNGEYRDCMRRFWIGKNESTAIFASRLCGSSDLYEQSGRRPYASINFVTCHDGFTLRDLVSYNVKHNEANGEENRDGSDHNESWNCGEEGETDKSEVVKMRDRQRRNLKATLMLSQGVPMILAGDELSHTQGGNNNVYCQDSEISWLDWNLTPEKKRFLAFTKRVIRLWAEQPVFQRRKFFQGRSIRGENVGDVSWFDPAGKDISDEEWGGSLPCLGMRLAGDLIGETDERGEPIVGDTLLLLVNSLHEDVPFVLPETNPNHRWERLFDTSDDDLGPGIDAGRPYLLVSRSCAAFRTVSKETETIPMTPLQAEKIRRDVRRAGPPLLPGTR